jgi:hypothetical protein
MFSVHKALSDFALSDNRPTQGFAIVSSDIGSILGVTISFGYDNTENATRDTSPSFVGTFGNVDYYIDYTHNNTKGSNIIVGSKTLAKTKGSAIIAPYKRTWEETNDDATGEPVYFVFDRTGMAINPVDNLYYQDGVGESQFVGKIDVDLEDIKSYLLFN